VGLVRVVRGVDLARRIDAAVRRPSRTRFVDRELGALASADPRISVLRDTLSGYLESGLSAAGAATVLNVSDRTVAYRLPNV
jgi:sugar diacid utilization regulator